MKIITETSFRLAEAQEEIKELKKENARLHNELAVLRARFKGSQPAMSSPVNSPQSKEIHYARPTVASRCRRESNKKASNEDQIEGPRFITVSNAKYTYKSGVPTAVADFKDRIPKGFAQSTEASMNRKWQIYLDRKEQLKTKPQRVYSTHWDSSLSDQSSKGDSINEPVDEMVDAFAGLCVESFVDFEDTTVKWLPEHILLQEDKIAQKTRLEDNLDFEIMVHTDATKSFCYLREAVEICQTVIYDKCNTNCPGWYPGVYGPHFVLLGRDEIITWTGHGRRPEGKYCGTIVYEALLRLVQLRNAISHPKSGELEDSCYVDGLLRVAQKFCVILGCETAAEKVRQLRDALSGEANQLWGDIMSLCEMIEHPFRGEFEFHRQHEKFLREAILTNRSPLLDPRIRDLAYIWVEQTGITLVHSSWGSVKDLIYPTDKP
ncbi:hypothetical protein F5Y14DRAFT_456148 [Nemania sp. NC0429]|nr:hypothetical protein F5Y14DRAFT_456148 [Nemania sp. NC0429]